MDMFLLVLVSLLSVEGEMTNLSGDFAGVCQKFNCTSVAGFVLSSQGYCGFGQSGKTRLSSLIPAVVPFFANDTFLPPSPVEPSSRYHMGSLTKSMTSSLVQILEEEGVLAWNTTLKEVFGAAASGIYANVSLNDLANHRSGIQAVPPKPDGFPGTGWQWIALTVPGPLKSQRLNVSLQLLQMDPIGQIGRGYFYSNGGYVVLGAVAEKLTGQSWEDLMQSKLFGPLGMSSAGFGAPTGQVQDTWASSHKEGSFPGTPFSQCVSYPNNQSQLVRCAVDNPPVMGPAGNAHMDVNDMGKYLRWHLTGHQGNPQPAGVMSAAGFQFLHTGDARPTPPGAAYGHGWITSKTQPLTYSHEGSNGRNRANMVL